MQHDGQFLPEHWKSFQEKLGIMNDAFPLLFAGLICALLSWAFWHLLGNDAFSVLLNIWLVCAVADNLRLRRKLRKLETSG